MTCIVYDWDDTLFPTTALNRLGYPQYRPFDLNQLTPEDQTSLQEIEFYIYQILDRSLLLGEVKIITNSGDGWVAQTITDVFPSLGHLLPHVEVISAHQRYAHLYPGDYERWKLETFKNELKDCKQVIAYGDAPHDRTALLKSLAELGQPALIKVFACKEEPTLLEHGVELQMMYATLPDVLTGDEPLDIDITPILADEMVTRGFSIPPPEPVAPVTDIKTPFDFQMPALLPLDAVVPTSIPTRRRAYPILPYTPFLSG